MPAPFALDVVAGGSFKALFGGKNFHVSHLIAGLHSGLAEHY